MTVRPQLTIDLWLDDLRSPEVDEPLSHPIFWAQTADRAIKTLESGPVRWASLDHDLGDNSPLARRHKEKTGYVVVLWMAEHEIWPTEGVIVHSWNPVGAENMCAVVDRYSPYRAIRRPAAEPGPPGLRD